MARIFEPRAPSPRDRLRTLDKVKGAGFTAGIAFMPILPFITDSELETMAKTAKELGCDYVFLCSLDPVWRGQESAFEDH